MSYFCTKCQRNHRSGKVFEEHSKYAKEEIIIDESEAIPADLVKAVSKHEETDWTPMFKSLKMSRYNEDGEYVERYMTEREKLEYAKSIALENGEKWNWLREHKRLRLLAKLV